jgi:hypothetical protein
VRKPSSRRLTADKLPGHVAAHQKRLGLKVGWETFCAMDDAGASTESIARTFKVDWYTADRWRNARQPYQAAA